MELEELKKVWEAYDQKLNRNLNLNEEILKRINLTHAKNEMKTPLLTEWLGVTPLILVLVFFLINTHKVWNQPFYLGIEVLIIILFILSICLSAKKISLLQKIDYYNCPILEVQQLILQFEQTYFRFKKYELLIAPFATALALLFAFKIIHNWDLLHSPLVFIRNLAIVFAVGFTISLWGYKNLYEKRIKRTHQFLKEIKVFEEDLK